MFWSAGCSLLRAEGCSCSMDVLYGGLGISKLQFLIQKISNFFFSRKFVGHQNPGSRSGPGAGFTVSGSETLLIIYSGALRGFWVRRFAIIERKSAGSSVPGDIKQGLMIFFLYNLPPKKTSMRRGSCISYFQYRENPVEKFWTYSGGGGSVFTYWSLFSTIVLSVFEILFYLATKFFPSKNSKKIIFLPSVLIFGVFSRENLSKVYKNIPSQFTVFQVVVAIATPEEAQTTTRPATHTHRRGGHTDHATHNQKVPAYSIFLFVSSNNKLKTYCTYCTVILVHVSPNLWNS